MVNFKNIVQKSLDSAPKVDIEARKISQNEKMNALDNIFGMSKEQLEQKKSKQIKFSNKLGGLFGTNEPIDLDG